MHERGWYYYDFLLITGDAYVDHPSFGTAVISRVLEKEGFRVAVLAQPTFESNQDFVAMGAPRYGVLINSGNVDSMVAHYSVAKRRRAHDEYTPGGKAGARPDRAVTVYSRLARQAFPEKPIIIGGIEASLRRFAHYDYWSDSVRPSVLIESGADMLSYGMGERSIVAIAKHLAAGKPIAQLTDLRGTCYLTEDKAQCPFEDSIILPSFDNVRSDKTAYAQAAMVEQSEHDAARGRALLQPHGRRFLVQNPPSKPLRGDELDAVYDLPFARFYHPDYHARGGVTAIEEVRFSIIHNRGCFGACNFCALAFHQGRYVSARSRRSVLKEAQSIIADADFKGYIHDIGGPTANFAQPACKKQDKHGACADRQCLFPTPCNNMTADHREYLATLRELRALPGVKKVFVRSGIRFDYMLHDKNGEFFAELVRHHVSGQLKVAPEHISRRVLYHMGKPFPDVYENFRKRFERLCEKYEKEQYIVPYLMSSHPGSELSDAVELALYLKRHRLNPEQVQDFYPTPGTLSTAMYHTGLDPRTMQEVFVAKSKEQKAMQRALLQAGKPSNHQIVRQALRLCEREDLIGFGKGFLVPPERGDKAKPKQADSKASKPRGNAFGKPPGRRQNGKKPPKPRNTK